MRLGGPTGGKGAAGTRREDPYATGSLGRGSAGSPAAQGKLSHASGRVNCDALRVEAREYDNSV